MTVKELIQKLELFPSDARVLVVYRYDHEKRQLELQDVGPMDFQDGEKPEVLLL